MAEEIVVESKYSEDKLLNSFLVHKNGPAPVKEPVVDQELTTNTDVNNEGNTSASTVSTDAVVETLDSDKLIIEKSGGKFKSLEEVLVAANKEPEYKVPDFVNEDSKRVYELLIEGKTAEVAAILSAQNKDYEKYSDIDVRKEAVKKDNPSWSDEDVSEFVNDRYGIGEAITDDDRTDLTPAQLREKEARIARYDRELKRDAKSDRQKLSLLKSEIKLPEVKPKDQPPVNTQAEEDQKAVQIWIDQVDEGVKSSPASVKYTYSIDIADGEDKGSYSTDFTIDGDNKKALDNYVKAFLPPLGSEGDYIKNGKVDVALITSEGIDKLFGKQMSKILLKESVAKAKQSVIDSIKNINPNSTDVTLTDQAPTREQELKSLMRS